MKSIIVENYLKMVRRELFGVESERIVEEISAHITEKAKDISNERNLKLPDDDVYREVITDLGSPEEVVRPYLKEMPIETPHLIKVFLILQMITGIAAFLVFIEGMDTLFWAFDQIPDDTGFILTQITSALLFLFVSIILGYLVIIQWRKPKKIATLGNISMIFSISIVITIIFVMFRIIIWNIWGVEYDENSYFPIAGIVMIGFIVIFIFGFQLLERFQRRIYPMKIIFK